MYQNPGLASSQGSISLLPGSIHAVLDIVQSVHLKISVYVRLFTESNRPHVQWDSLNRKNKKVTTSTVEKCQLTRLKEGGKNERPTHSPVTLFLRAFEVIVTRGKGFVQIEARVHRQFRVGRPPGPSCLWVV